MARAVHVKAARKAYPEHGIEKGQEYWHVSFRVGRGSVKRFYTKPPRPSQLTNSEYLSTIYGFQEQLEDEADLVKDADDVRNLESVFNDVAEEIRSLGEEQDEKYNNMPEGLQEGDTGQLLQARAEACQTIADEIDSVANELASFESSDLDDSEATEEEKIQEIASEACEFVQEQLANISWEVE